MSGSPSYRPQLARKLILDEMFDLSLYRALQGSTGGKMHDLLDELVRIETMHVDFWQNFFGSRLRELDFPRRLKLWIITMICRLFGAPAIHLVLEAIEVYGVRKYLSLWKIYKDQPLGEAIKGILVDEFKHEDALVTQGTDRKLNPEQIRNIFLGLNDGLVEILGAVSGFFAAFGNTAMVLLAGATTAVAGSLSMAAGAYVAISSEREVEETEHDKKRFLGEVSGPIRSDESTAAPDDRESPFASAFVVGGSYFAGAMIPLLPVLFGAENAVASLIAGGSVIILVSMILAFLSGMNIERRIVTNLIIIAAAVGVTYAIGTVVKNVWGIDV
jgi:VIT1/CCC1 family predicted Fe2+/Mn2+ transporter